MPVLDAQTAHLERTPDAPSPAPSPAQTAATFPPPASINARQMWANNRFWMETQNLVTKRYGGKRKQQWYALLVMMKTFEWGLKRIGQFERGWQNAANIVLRDLDLYFPRLPRAFDGFTILHISDPHLDGMPGIEDRIVELTRGREFDLCVLTGDYRTELHGPIRHVMASLERIVRGVRTKQGFLGILGNHDDCHMVAPMEAMGIRMLINENVALTKDGERIRIVGTDDVHYYYTDMSLHALEAARDDFTIALIHSPELFDAAEAAGVSLYLTGHTHAGQVVLPGGRVLIKHLRAGRDFYRGHWRYRDMQGITNAGAGTSGIPVRFNTESEILALHLHRA